MSTTPEAAQEPPAPSFLEGLRRTPVSVALIVINVVVFALAESVGSTTSIDTLLQFGATWRGLVWQGQYWRLATSMFLHIGVIHLAWNAWMGLRLSRQAEQALGHWRFLGLYLTSGIVGSAASVIGHDAVSAGASGALFGIVGWRLYTLRLQEGSFSAFINNPTHRNELINIAVWFALGAFAGFDNFAHGGGLAWGVLIAWMLADPARSRRFATAAVGILVVALSLRPLPMLHARDVAFEAVQQTITAGRYSDALPAAEQLVADYPNDGHAYALRGVIRSQLEDLAGARSDYQRSIDLDGNAWAKQNLESLDRYEEDLAAPEPP